MVEQFANPVISVIVQNGDNPELILLQLRNKGEVPEFTGLFELPQGRLRQGESILECAARELLEETGLIEFHACTKVHMHQIGPEVIQSASTVAVSETGFHSFLAVCIVGKARGVPRPSEESTQPTWYNRDQVLRLITEGRVFPLNIPMILHYYNHDSAHIGGEAEACHR